MMQTTDTLLVEQSRNGDRDAFAEIVRRYQTLVCSIAYATTGNLNSSEELAQETFVSAWGSIAKLHEPSKLRQWLSGIVRNLANNHTRHRKRDVLAKAANIDQTSLSDEHTGNPSETAIAREEIDLLNRTLTSLPEQYREPLVLFYREDQSVARVAELLELSTDNVKQRLTRGRKMLRDEVATLVERGLEQSTPRRAFTVGVLASLPLLTGTAQAATLTATTAKGASVMKAVGWTGILGIAVGPIVGLLGSWFGYSMSMKSARSDRERKFVKRFAVWILSLALLMAAGLLLIITMGRELALANPSGFAIGIVSYTVGYTIALGATIIWGNRGIAKIRREDGTVDLPPKDFEKKLPPFARTLQAKRSYESKMRLLGLPFISVQFGGANLIGKGKRKPAVGWIAIGDLAYGVLFACGSVAVGGIAVGAIGIGLLSCGGLAVGAVALGGSAIGYWSLGGLAAGFLAFGGVALAWKGAIGGLALAHDYAMGGVAVAEQTNNEAAKSLIANETFFAWGQWMMTPWSWWIAMVILLSPMIIAIILVKPDKATETTEKTPH